MQAYEAPQGQTEVLLASIWSDLLGVERVGRYDNFFALGGHSLLAVRVLSRVREALGVGACTYAICSRIRSRASLATVVKLRRAARLSPIFVASRDAPLPLSFAQQRLWFLAQLDGVSRAYHVPLRCDCRASSMGRHSRGAGQPCGPPRDLAHHYWPSIGEPPSSR